MTRPGLVAPAQPMVGWPMVVPRRSCVRALSLYLAISGCGASRTPPPPPGGGSGGEGGTSGEGGAGEVDRPDATVLRPDAAVLRPDAGASRPDAEVPADAAREAPPPAP